jgi:hypothetical protein
MLVGAKERGGGAARCGCDLGIRKIIPDERFGWTISKERSSFVIGNTHFLGHFLDGGWSAISRKALKDCLPGKILSWSKFPTPCLGKTGSHAASTHQR